MHACITTNRHGLVNDDSTVTVDGTTVRLFERSTLLGNLAPARIAETLAAMGYTLVPGTLSVHEGCRCVEVEVEPAGPGPHPRAAELLQVND